MPLRRKSFCKFWWSQGLDLLNDNSFRSHIIWLTAGKPHSGLIADQRRKDTLAYKHAIHVEQQRERTCYTNNLHEALLQKSGSDFLIC